MHVLRHFVCAQASQVEKLCIEYIFLNGFLLSFFCSHLAIYICFEEGIRMSNIFSHVTGRDWNVTLSKNCLKTYVDGSPAGMCSAALSHLDFPPCCLLSAHTRARPCQT